jgi:hypothetical protein
MGLWSRSTENRIKQQCHYEYFEQMKWTYDGGFRDISLKEKDPNRWESTRYMSTAYAHIDASFKALEPVHAFYLGKGSEVSADTEIQILELELLKSFCTEVDVDFTLTVEHIKQDAKTFVEDNAQKGETYQQFKTRFNKMERSLYWREEVDLEWIKYRTSRDKKTQASSVKNKNKNVLKKKSASSPIEEKVNWGKVKKPYEMDVEKKLKLVKSEPITEKPRSKKQKRVPKNKKLTHKEATIISISDERSKRFFDYLKGETNNEDLNATELFTTAFTGWSWMCEVHRCYGIGDSEDEVLNMAGSHMYYKEFEGAKCEIFTREFN